MPFSSTSGKKFISSYFNKLATYHSEVLNDKECRIVDFGPGEGYYERSLRKAIDSRLKQKSKWTGVEIFQPYIEKYSLESKYDEVKCMSAQEFVSKTFEAGEQHSVGIFGDIIEHIELEEAKKLHEQALDVFDFTVISIPLGSYPQDEYDGNPFERHVTDNWSHESVLQTFGYCVAHHIENEIGVYIFSKNDDIEVQLKAAAEPKIGVYIICKNEENFIYRCIDSAFKADEIVVVDTGSTDLTKKIVTEIFQYHLFPTLKSVSIQPWRFDEAKNCALSFLGKDIDIAVSLDADEVLEDGWYEALKKEFDPQITRYNHRFSTHWNWDKELERPNISEHWHDRIHSRHGYLWSMPVHEILVKKGPPEVSKFITSVAMKQLPDTSKSRSSYYDLLKISVTENPEIWKSWLFLADEEIARDNHQEFLSALDKALNCKDSDKCFILRKLLGYWTAKDLAMARSIANQLVLTNTLHSGLREYFYYACLFFESVGLIAEAKNAIEKAQKSIVRSQGYDCYEWCWTKEFTEYCKRIEAL